MKKSNQRTQKTLFLKIILQKKISIIFIMYVRHKNLILLHQKVKRNQIGMKTWKKLTKYARTETVI